MSSPSDKAVAALQARYGFNTIAPWREIAATTHDPALGLDRSVCLRDVVESVRMLRGTAFSAGDIADLIEREFGGGS